ncbi:MAG: metallophosphoesterase family protein [Candidatus Hodarchaeales archaeon]
MKILHTADIHLSERNPETLRSLELIIELAKKIGVDLLTIGGDLFDTYKDAEALRIEVRKCFSGLDFPVIAIPGNHDNKVFKKSLDFGTSFQALTVEPVEIYASTDENINIIGVPFVDRVSDGLLSSLKDNRRDGAVNILILHCTLDIAFSSDDFGDEKEREYFSIDKATLNSLGYDFILAGHFHSRFDKRRLGPNCVFVYPGSPLSLSWKETGKRGVALLDTESKTIKHLSLESSYYRDVLAVDVTISRELEAIQKINGWIKDIKEDNGEFIVKINGFGEIGEIDFREKLETTGKNIMIENEYRDVTRVIDHPLYQLFIEELEHSSTSINRDLLKNRIIQAMGVLFRG